MKRRIENVVAVLTAAGCVHASGMFCASWFFPAGLWGDFLDFIR